MNQLLYEQYGYVIIPKGTIVFRMGNIDYQYGAFFALEKQWADNFKSNNDDVKLFRTEKDLKLLFLIKTLTDYGLPIGAISDLYKNYIDNECKIDDVGIKWDSKLCKSRLISFLQENNINGWLSSQETSNPLEIFINPKALINIVEINDVNNYKSYNALRHISLFPSNDFLNSIKKQLDDYEDLVIFNNDDFSIFKKIKIYT